MSEDAHAESRLALYRITGAVALLAALFAIAWAAYFAFSRAPAIESMLKDFNQPIPRLTMIVLRQPWLPLTEAPFAFLVALLAVIRPHPLILALAHLLVYALLMTVLLFSTVAWFPVEQLLHAL